MFKHKDFFNLLLFFILFASDISASASDKVSRNDLENIWFNYIDAYKSGDIKKIEKLSSKYSFSYMKNNLISSKRIITREEFVGSSNHLPNVKNSIFSTVVQVGDTAALIYNKNPSHVNPYSTQSSQYIQGNSNPVYIKFLREPDGWKVDGVTMTELPRISNESDLPKYDFTKLPNERFALDGKVKKAEELFAEPDLMGYINLISKEYITKIYINDIEQVVANYTSSYSLIRGGLNKNKNTMRVVISGNASSAKIGPNIKVDAVLKMDGTRIIERSTIFEFAPKDRILGEHIAVFP